MSINPKDYCVSLEMAQRAELHEAMRAAGCKTETPTTWPAGNPGDMPSENCWLKYADYTGERGFRAGTVHLTGCDYLCGFGYAVGASFWPAYHLGELWCAAMHFAAEGNGVMLQHRAQPRTLAEPVMAKSGDTGGEFATSAHAPDALAELVIALHKGAAQ